MLGGQNLKDVNMSEKAIVKKSDQLMVEGLILLEYLICFSRVTRIDYRINTHGYNFQEVKLNFYSN